MLYLFRLLLLLINIDQETVLNWFGIKDPTTSQITNGQDLNFSNINSSTDVSINTIRLVIEGLWDKIQDGLTLADIENILFFILFVRFIILVIRYNLKTSFYITCIGLFASYLWYRHLIDIVTMYKQVLLNLPFLRKLGIDAVQLQSFNRQTVLSDLKLEENTNWYNPGKMIYYSIMKGIINVDPETGRKYYIDPISMIISKIQTSNNSTLVSCYYTLYHKIIPKIFEICTKFWAQLSGIAAYAVITRIGKRYCPYLIRWHWTLLLIITMIEQIFISFIFRASYFQNVLRNNIEFSTSSSLQLQTQLLNVIIASVVLTHVGFILFALFHAIWGQYFYLPFFVENTELHIGSRPKNSIYSGGKTAWQDTEEKEKKLNGVFSKLWYGWFGRGTQDSWQKTSTLQKLLNKIIKRLKKQFRR